MSKNESRKKTYAKHHVKRKPPSMKLMEENGVPVLGEKIRETRITEEQATTLNNNSMTSGYVWVLSKGHKKDATGGDEKTEIITKLQKLVDEGKLEKLPHPATGVPKLKELLTKLEKGE
jgi:hypothetical protein